MRWSSGSRRRVWWSPRTHTNFDADALVVQGDMCLTVGDVVRHRWSGVAFALNANVLDAERYGSEGATSWVARCIPSDVAAD